jgi:Mrp family chromosome partitioning ATPase
MNQRRPIAEAQRSSVRQPRLLPLPVALVLSTMPLIVAAGIAFLWPATYASRAVVLLEPHSPAAARALTANSPGETGDRLRQQLLEPAALGAWTGALDLGNAAPEIGERVGKALRVVPDGGLSYGVEFRWRKPSQVEQATNAAAQRLAERAAEALGIPPEPVKHETEIQKRTRELAEFMAAHPELALEAPRSSPSGERPNDLAFETLKRERARLERAIADAERAPKSDSDNPYVDPAPRVEELRVRLIHVRSAIAKYEASAKEKKPAVTPAEPGLQAEWRKKLDALAEARKSADKAPQQNPMQPALTARVTKVAPLPGRPEKPNRPLILGVGGLVTLGLGGMLTAMAFLRITSRSSPSARPGPNAAVPARPADPALAQAAALDPLQRQSSRPPPGAGAYAHSANKPDSDPPPPDHVPINALQRSKSPPPAPNPYPYPAPLHPSPTHVIQPQPIPMQPFQAQPILPPPAPGPDAAFGQIPWMERAAPEPAPQKPAAARGNGALAAEQAARPRRSPMKRTTTLIHGSMIQPDGLPPPEPEPELHIPEVIEAEAYVVGEPVVEPPAPVQNPARPAQNAMGVSVTPAGEYWTAGVARSMAGWLIGLRDELCKLALERSLGRCFVVMISCGQGAQRTKSDAVAKLSLALAETGHPRILLMEGDFDRPAVHHVMGVEMPRSAGFSQQMHNRIHGHAGGNWTVVECQPTLHVLAEGRVRSPGLLHSFQFETAVNDLRRHYEMIVIDGPALSVNTDMRALEAVVDGIIVVQKPGGREPTPVERALFGSKLLKIVVADPVPHAS